MKPIKHIILCTLYFALCTFVCCSNIFSQVSNEKDTVYHFVDKKINKHTSVKNQNKSGTCWSFSATSFLESEILRKSGKEYDLADMYPVYRTYQVKADRYVRMHGECNFPIGGASGDVFWTLKNYGFMPEEVFTGLRYGKDKHDHILLGQLLKNILDAVIKSQTLDSAWKFPYNAMLDAYLGTVPNEFTFQDKKYTPDSFGKSLGLNPDEYVEITSYTPHPFYESFAIEVPDNWLINKSYNVPINEFLAIAKNALDKGYTLLWGGDVSEKGWSWKDGFAIVPNEEEQESLKGTDRERWNSLDKDTKAKEVYSFDKIVDEKTITQEMRQKAFDSWQATDDHGMHIVGYAVDEKGNYFFKVKNSWDTDQIFDGYIYMSVPFFALNGLDITVHKDAIPKEIFKKLVN
jgi:bleomycin hydrolase